MEMQFRTFTDDGRPCCAVNHVEHLCGRCRAQGRAAGARAATTGATLPRPTTTPASDALTAAEGFRATLRTGWRTSRAVPLTGARSVPVIPDPWTAALATRQAVTR